MTDNVTNALLLETLKAVQAKLAEIAADIKADNRGQTDFGLMSPGVMISAL